MFDNRPKLGGTPIIPAGSMIASDMTNKGAYIISDGPVGMESVADPVKKTVVMRPKKNVPVYQHRPNIPVSCEGLHFHNVLADVDSNGKVNIQHCLGWGWPKIEKRLVDTIFHYLENELRFRVVDVETLAAFSEHIERKCSELPFSNNSAGQSYTLDEVYAMEDTIANLISTWHALRNDASFNTQPYV